MNLVIDRQIWLRGTGNSHSRLLRDGKRCCLGVYLGAMGLPDLELNGIPSPAATRSAMYIPTFAWLVDQRGNSKLANRLMAVNDAQGIDEETRELWITEGFRQAGITVAFEN